MNQTNIKNTVPKGYKQTKLGVIPEEWKIVKLGEIGKVKMCKRIFSDETLPKGEIPFYKIGTFGKKADAYISNELYKLYKNKFSYPKVGEILMSASGTLGRTVVFDGEPSYFQDSNIVWISHNETKILNEFLLYVYKIIRYDSEGGTIQRLYNSIILNAKLRLPPLPEQRKIAAILSTWDKAIEKQEKVIAKKEHLKKGLMQQLLTGKKRFAGFTEEWKEVKLGDVCIKKSSNLSANSISENTGEFPVYGASGFIKKVDFYNESESYISIVKDGAGVGRVLLCDGKSSILGTLDIIQPNSSTNINFLYNLLITIDFRKYIIGSTIPHIYFKDYSLKKIKLPSIEEQQKIANVLSKADNEIENLKKQLATMKLQKQGLMQELLTGRRRVKYD